MDSATRVRRRLILSLVIILFFIIFLNLNIFAEELKVSPTSLEFKGKINEKLCQNLNLVPAENILSSSKWSNRKSQDLKDYIFQASDKNISVQFEIISKNKIEACIISNKSQIAYGVFLFRQESSSFGIGAWVKLDLDISSSVNESANLEKDDNNKASKNTSLSSSSSSGENNEVNNSNSNSLNDLRMSGRAVLEQGGANKFFYFFILEAILLGIFLVYLMKKMGGKRSHASSFSIEFKNSKKRKKNDS